MLPEIFEVDRKTGLPVDPRIKWRPPCKFKKHGVSRGTRMTSLRTLRRWTRCFSWKRGSSYRRETDAEVEFWCAMIHQSLERQRLKNEHLQIQRQEYERLEKRLEQQFREHKLEELRLRERMERDRREYEQEVNDHNAITHYDDGRRSFRDPCHPSSKSHHHCVRLTPEDTVVTYFDKLQALHIQEEQEEEDDME